jgi:dihydroorotate dehydrogenase (NAD+) catalytic subunit
VTDLAVRLGPLELRNPVVTASGTFGYGVEFADFVDLSRIGGLSTKGLSLRPHEGNPPPRICEVDGGMLNAIGLQNIGAEAFVADKLPKLRELGATVIANVWGDSDEEYEAVVERLAGEPGVAAIELNVSCPNVTRGGMIVGNDPTALRTVVRKCRAKCPIPLIVKLSPNVTDIRVTARAAVDGGADILSLINTLVGMSIDVQTRRPRIGFTTGGLSGPAIRPVAVRMVFQVARELPDVPLMGIGGIEKTEDAVEFLLAGASAIQVGTANLRNPAVSMDLVRGLDAFCSAKGISKVTDLVGKVETRTPGAKPLPSKP